MVKALNGANEFESLTEPPRCYSILVQRWILAKSVRFAPGPRYLAKPCTNSDLLRALERLIAYAKGRARDEIHDLVAS